MATQRGKPKAQPRKRVSRADRSRILEEARTQGLTADQIAKKYGVSRWTVYGWRKRRAGQSTRSTVSGGGSRGARGSLGEMLRPLINDMVREEMQRLLASTR